MTSPYSACLILAFISLVHAAQPPPYGMMFSVNVFALLKEQFKMLNTQIIDQVPEPNTKILNNRDLELSWTVDWDNEEVTFTVENPFKPDRRYFMFGFTFWSDTNSSDYCLFDRDDPTKITVSAKSINQPRFTFISKTFDYSRMVASDRTAKCESTTNRTGICLKGATPRFRLNGSSIHVIRMIP